MEAQRFLTKYEQDKCEYCHGKNKYLKSFNKIYYNDLTLEETKHYMDIYIKGGNKLTGEFFYIDEDDSGGETVSKRINFCPMCGRELNKEV